MLFAVRFADIPAAPWWTAAGQSHGHIQLFGWAGLMVIGVGFHFLPRLRGVRLVRPALTRLILALLALGLLLCALTQPVLAGGLSGPAAGMFRAGLVLSGVFEFGGAALTVVLLSMTLRQQPTLPKRTNQESVFVFFPVAFSCSSVDWGSC